MKLKKLLSTIDQLINSELLENRIGNKIEYYHNQGVFETIRFEKGDEGISIQIRLNPLFSERTSEKLEGKKKITLPYELEHVVVRWNMLKDRSVEEAIHAVKFYKKVSQIAASIEELIESNNLVDHFYELEAPPQPSEMDRYASYNNPTLIPSMSKKELQEKARDHGLAVSGTKDALKVRIWEHAQKVGDASKVEALNEWYSQGPTVPA